MASVHESIEVDEQFSRGSLLFEPVEHGLCVAQSVPQEVLEFGARLDSQSVAQGSARLVGSSGIDIALIIGVSAFVPMIGNLGLALSLDRARRLLSSPKSLRRLNVTSGVLLVLVGLVIPFL